MIAVVGPDPVIRLRVQNSRWILVADAPQQMTYLWLQIAVRHTLYFYGETCSWLYIVVERIMCLGLEGFNKVALPFYSLEMVCIETRNLSNNNITTPQNS